MTDTILVTGGTGYVAGWCIVQLLRRGYDVRTTVRSPAKSDAVHAAIATAIDPGTRLACFVADLTHDAGWDSAVAGCRAVLHVASPLGADDAGGPDALIVPAHDGKGRSRARLDGATRDRDRPGLRAQPDRARRHRLNVQRFLIGNVCAKATARSIHGVS